ncbi:MAG: DUF547 domain-containing protein [Betaproteobacteria bacterium]
MKYSQAIAVLALALLVSMTPVRAQPSDPYSPWTRVLAQYVNAQGEVDFHALARSRSDLDAFLDFVARVSPRSAPASFASHEARLAYYINTYNALAMFNVIDSDFPRSLSGLTKVKFFGFKRFTIGDERMTLYTLENDVIRPLGDERVHFALNCMSVGCPRLPRTPFRAETLDRQLDAEARRFFGDERNLRVDRQRRLVQVSSILKFYTNDFLARMPSLIAYINLYANVQVPSDYNVEFIDYDWTINDQQREKNSSSVFNFSAPSS